MCVYLIILHSEHYKKDSTDTQKLQKDKEKRCKKQSFYTTEVDSWMRQKHPFPTTEVSSWMRKKQPFSTTEVDSWVLGNVIPLNT